MSDQTKVKKNAARRRAEAKAKKASPNVNFIDSGSSTKKPTGAAVGPIGDLTALQKAAAAAKARREAAKSKKSKKSTKSTKSVKSTKSKKAPLTEADVRARIAAEKKRKR